MKATARPGGLAATGLDELDPLIDPYRCRACLDEGDSCAFHRLLGVAVDATFQLALNEVTP